jgi:hypothetical protein
MSTKVKWCDGGGIGRRLNSKVSSYRIGRSVRIPPCKVQILAHHITPQGNVTVNSKGSYPLNTGSNPVPATNKNTIYKNIVL